MRKTVCFLLTAIVLFSYIKSHACVGRILTVGIVNSVNETLLAELVSVLINERTGTTVNIKFFDSWEEIYEAVKKEEIGIVIENTDHALQMLNLKSSGDKKTDYNTSKKEFRERFNLIWLKPFGFITTENGKEQRYYAAVITQDVLINFPALPRVVNKLRDITGDRRFKKILKSVKSGSKTKRVARDFLKKKKLI
jgi:glycine betaine/choline ABC-type transport system substrate-binding protein